MSFVVAKEQPVVGRGQFNSFQPVHPWTMQPLLQRENIFVFVSLFLASVAICCFKWIFYTVRCRIYILYIYILYYIIPGCSSNDACRHRGWKMLPFKFQLHFLFFIFSWTAKNFTKWSLRYVMKVHTHVRIFTFKVSQCKHAEKWHVH